MKRLIVNAISLLKVKKQRARLVEEEKKDPSTPAAKISPQGTKAEVQRPPAFRAERGEGDVESAQASPWLIL